VLKPINFVSDNQKIEWELRLWKGSCTIRRSKSYNFFHLSFPERAVWCSFEAVHDPRIATGNVVPIVTIDHHSVAFI
jgi:hypothetical protein